MGHVLGHVLQELGTLRLGQEGRDPGTGSELGGAACEEDQKAGVQPQVTPAGEMHVRQERPAEC